VSGLSSRAARKLADLRRRSDKLKGESDELEHRSDDLGRRTEEVRQDWRRKRADPGVPGAVPEEREGPGADSPEGRDRGEDLETRNAGEQPERQDEGS
jgi:hypothetical protein